MAAPDPDLTVPVRSDGIGGARQGGAGIVCDTIIARGLVSLTPSATEIELALSAEYSGSNGAKQEGKYPPTNC